MRHLRTIAATVAAGGWLYLLATHPIPTIGGTAAIAWTAVNATTRRRRR